MNAARLRFRKSAAAFVCAGLLLAGCAPAIMNYKAAPSDPLYGKHIGVVFDPALFGALESVDPHDVRDYLKSLCKSLSNHGENLTFVDFTREKPALGKYKAYVAVKTGPLGDSIKTPYRIPERPLAQAAGDSLDFLLLIEGLSFSGGITVPLISFGGYGGGVLPHGPGGPFVPQASSSANDGYEESSSLDFLLWNARTGEPADCGKAELKHKARFGTETTTFAQDGESMGKEVLGKLLARKK
jgi:hypothetical protein